MRFAAVSIVALSLGSMAVAYPAENMQTEAALPNFDLLLAGPPADCWDHNTDESACHAWSAEIHKHGLEGNITELWAANPPKELVEAQAFTANYAAQAKIGQGSTGLGPGCPSLQGEKLEKCQKKKTACCALAWTLIPIFCCSVNCDTCDPV